jgi:hypothetical protein
MEVSLLSWLLTEIVELIAIAAGLFLIAALLAPFESLGWWAGWSQRWPGPVSLPEMPAVALAPGPTPTCYLVYLSGVGNMGPSRLSPKEQHFLDLLAARLPGAAVIHDVFPYSAVNNPLTRDRPLSWFWRWVARAIRRPGTKNLFQLVGVRNALQVAVSADRRYGPVFNFGVARQIMLQLLRRGYQVGDRAPIVLIGLSGSGQIAVGGGAALHRLLRAPVWVVSIGGVLTSDPGILEVERVFHLSGSKDRTQYLGLVLYPGCWPIFRSSAWNRALVLGKRTVIPVGPMKHMGHGDYFCRSCALPDGQLYVEHTAAVIAEAVAGPIAAAAECQRTNDSSSMPSSHGEAGPAVSVGADSASRRRR